VKVVEVTVINTFKVYCHDNVLGDEIEQMCKEYPDLNGFDLDDVDIAQTTTRVSSRVLKRYTETEK